MTTARFVVSAARRPIAAPLIEPTPVEVTPEETAVDERGFRLPAARIAVWQAALVAGFAGIGRGTVVTVVAATIAAGVLMLSAARVRGEWLSVRAGTALSFLLRKRSRARDWVPLPRGSVITPDGTVAGADGWTIVTRAVRLEIPRLEAEELSLRLVIHLADRREPPDAWLAVTALRSPEDESDDMLRTALDNALRHLRRKERDAVLGPVELRSTLLRLAHAGAGRETWTCWRSDGVTQICLRARATRPEILPRLLQDGFGAAVTIALHRTAGGGEGVVRVAAGSDAAAERAVTRITALGARLGVRLDRLDGRHGPAALASLPIGGSL